MTTAKKKPGLYANMHDKQERIAHGSGEKMRKPGSAGAPTDAAFAAAAKTTRDARAKKPAARKTSAKAPRGRTGERKSA